MKLFLNNGNKHVGEYGASDSPLHRVLAVAQKLLGAQVLLDPFEEKLDLLSTRAWRSYCFWLES